MRAGMQRRLKLQQKLLRRRRFTGTALLLLGIPLFMSAFYGTVSTPTTLLSAQDNVLSLTPHSQTEASNWRLTIPTIKLDATIQKVGTNQAGNMNVPSSYEAVGWLNTSARPGATGNTVLSGHFSADGKKTAVFDKLHTVTAGDVIRIADNATDTQAVYTVTKIAKYERNNAPLPDIFGDSATKNLRLITCAGTWEKTHKDYTHRLVVYATVQADE